MIVPDPCEAFPRVCEDRYINVCTFRTPKYALACVPGASGGLKTLRNFVSVSGFRIEHVAPLQADMRTLHQPTLLIWGRQDRLVPRDHACILEANLPRCRTLLFEECGHLPQLEQSRQFNAAVLDFLRQTG